MKRRREDDAPDEPDSSKRRDVNTEDRSNGSMGGDVPILQSNHKIFLSHSGAQKEFVEQLCRDLENCYHFPFFDRRHSSLPKGERFPELILKAARECQMAVVVVSKEYFESKWPMIELHAFVQARLRSNPNLKILPLFYQLSVQEFGNERRREQWFNVWEDLARIDPRINVDEWKESLKMLASFNGIEYNPDSGGEAYREKIVSSICKEVPSDIKWDDSHVKGQSTLCKELLHRIDHIRTSMKKGFYLIGIYGVGGIGKTTICKALCNELFQELKGNVSHVEFGSGTYKELLIEVLKDLTSMNQDYLQQLNEDKCKHILLNRLNQYKIFLAIDNVWDDIKSIEEAKGYLQAHFHEESIVMVTSRSLETLIHLGINESHCFEMPSLQHEDAMNLFLHHAAYGIPLSNYNIDDKHSITRCIALCYFNKGGNKNGHYLPLALKALGVQLGCIGKCPSKWVEALPKVRDFNFLQEKENPVFSILRSSFDRLLPMHQSLFMDLILYSPTTTKTHYIDSKDLGLIEWLSIVYSQDFKEIGSQLQHLKVRGLVEDVDIASQTVYVHDLYREFAKFESKGNLNESAAFEKKGWVYYEDAYPAELEMTPANRCWQNLKRIRIFESEWYIGRHNQLQSMQDIEWRYFSNVVVLKLDWLFKLRGELNLKGLKCLRSLDLTGIYGLDSLDGLQDLNKLTYFRWITNPSAMATRTRIGQLPLSLKILHLAIEVLLIPQMFARCTKLSKVKLGECRAENLDFSNCPSLQSVGFRNFQADIVNLSNCSSLQSVALTDCRAEATLDRISNCTSLRYAELNQCSGPKLDFSKLASLQSAKLRDCRAENLDFNNCASLQTITLEGVSGLEPESWLSIDGLQELSNLTSFRWTRGWTTRWTGMLDIDVDPVHARMGQLPASLKVLELDVEVMLKADVFAHCTNLREVKLARCGAENLDFKNCPLQTITLEDVQGLQTRSLLSVDGLEDLNNLICFTWRRASSFLQYINTPPTMRQLPASLKVLELDVEVMLKADVFARCTNLSEVKLARCRAEKLEFSQCAYLHRLTLENVQIGVESVSARSVDGHQDLSNLIYFTWSACLTKDYWAVTASMEQLPATFKVLVQLDVEVLLRTVVFPHSGNLTKLKLCHCRAENLDFKNCASLRSAELSDCRAEKLDFTNCPSLRSISLEGVNGLETESWLSIDGLQELSNLTSFSWTRGWITRWTGMLDIDVDPVHARMGQLPASLKVLELDVEVMLKADGFSRCTNLSEVKLARCRGEKLDFSQCASLHRLTLEDVQIGVESVSARSVDGHRVLSNVIYFRCSVCLTEDCWAVTATMEQLPATFKVLVQLDVEVLLRAVVFPYSGNLSKLNLCNCRAENLDFTNCPSLESITLEGVSGLEPGSWLSIDGLQELSNLTSFRWTRGRTARWTGMLDIDVDQVHARMGQLPASLQVLELDGEFILKANVFARCTNLLEVKLAGCRGEKLDFSQCASLHRLTLEDVQIGVESVSARSIDGHEDLSNLIYFRWSARLTDDCWAVTASMEQLPATFKVLVQLDVEVLLRTVVFPHSGNLTKLKLCHCRAENLDFKNCASLRSAELSDCRAEKLDFTNCPSLGSITLEGVSGLEPESWPSIDGLQELSNLTSFSWTRGRTTRWTGMLDIDVDPVHARMGQLPASLKVLELDVEVMLKADVFARGTNLSVVKLARCRGENLDFSQCASLHRLTIEDVQIGVESVSAWSVDGHQVLSNLIYFTWSACLTEDCWAVTATMEQLPATFNVLVLLNVEVLLRAVVFPHSGNLTKLKLCHCRAENLDFKNCASLRSAELSDCHAEKLDFTNCPSLGSITLEGVSGLEPESWLSIDGLQELSNLTSFRWTRGRTTRWTGMLDIDVDPVRARMGQLPASLKVLELDVEVMLNADGFSRCTNSREVKLARCGVENLDFKNCPLQTITLEDVQGLQTRSLLSVDGLEDLNNLICFTWRRASSLLQYINTPAMMRQLPASLKVLELDGEFMLKADVFTRCTNLSEVKLARCLAEKLEFSQCAYLHRLTLQNVQIGVESVSARSVDGHQDLSNLIYFTWSACLTEDCWAVTASMEQLPATFKVLVLLDLEVLLRAVVIPYSGNSTKLNLSNCRAENLDFKNCASLRSAELSDCRAEKLDFTNCPSLRSITLEGVNGLETDSWLSIDGLQELSNLTSFRWTRGWTTWWTGMLDIDGDPVHARMGQLPASLKVLELDVEVMLKADGFSRCTNLSEVKLARCRAEKLDFSQCGSLHRLTLEDVQIGVESVSVRSVDGHQVLSNVIYFRCSVCLTEDCWAVTATMEQLPATFKVLVQLDVEVLLRAVVFPYSGNLSKLNLCNCRAENLDFKNCASLRSAELSDCHAEKLDFTNCPSLRSITLERVSGLETESWLSIDGLQELSNLTSFRWTRGRTARWTGMLDIDVDQVHARMGQLPASLQVLELDGEFILKANVLARCTNLREVKLAGCRGEKLDFSQCACLHGLTLEDVQIGVESVAARSVDGHEDLSNLIYFRWSARSTEDCWAVTASMEQLPATFKVLVLLDVEVLLRTVVFPHSGNLTKLKLCHCRAENLDFKNCASLRSAELSDCRAEKLDFTNCPSLRSISLEGVNGLDPESWLSIDGLQELSNLSSFSWTRGWITRWTGMLDIDVDPVHARMGQLPASLKVLELDVEVMLKADGFSRCTNLSEVKLARCRGEKLDFSQCACLHRPTFEDVQIGMESVSARSVDGHQDLSNLIYFTLSARLIDDCWAVTATMEQLPATFKVLVQLDVEVLLRVVVFPHSGNLTKLKLCHCRAENLDFKNCASLRSAELSDCRAEKLDFTNCPSLRSITLEGVNGLEPESWLSIDGLQELSNLTSFRWTRGRTTLWTGMLDIDVDPVHARMGQLPASLKVLELDVEVMLKANVFARCTNLSEVKLARCGAENLDFKNCPLQTITLEDVQGLQTRSLLSVDGLEDLNNLICFTWRRASSLLQYINTHATMRQLPASLKVLELDVEVILKVDVFARCTNLSEVKLARCRAEKLDFSECACLHRLTLEDVQIGVESVSARSVDGHQDLSNLIYFRWSARLTDDCWAVTATMEQLPATFEVLVLLDVEVLLRTVVFRHSGNLTKLKLCHCRAENLDFNNCQSLRSAELSDCRAEKLDFTNCPSLRSITLEGVNGLETDSWLSIDGLQELSNLTSFRWTRGRTTRWTGMVDIDVDPVRVRMGQLPASLKVLELDVEVMLNADGFSRCTNLSEVKLARCRAEKLDFSQCGSLHRLTLEDVQIGVESVSARSVDGHLDLSNLIYFRWSARLTDDCWAVTATMEQLPATFKVLVLLDVEVLLRTVVFPHSGNLTKLKLCHCRAENLDFKNCSSLRSAELSDCRAEKLDFTNCPSLRSLTLEGVNGLETDSWLSIDGLQELSNLTSFRWTRGLTTRWTGMLDIDVDPVHARMGQLPASLKVLELDVEVMLKADVFARCTNLSEVKLARCRGEKLGFSQCACLHRLTLEDGMESVSER